MIASLLALCVFLSAPFWMATHHHLDEAAESCPLCILSSAVAIGTPHPSASIFHNEECTGLRLENEAIVSLNIVVERPARAPPRCLPIAG